MTVTHGMTLEEFNSAYSGHVVRNAQAHYADMKERERLFRESWGKAWPRREDAPDDVRPLIDAATMASIRAWDEAQAARIASYGGRNRQERRRAAKEGR